MYQLIIFLFLTPVFSFACIDNVTKSVSLLNKNQNISIPYVDFHQRRKNNYSSKLNNRLGYNNHLQGIVYSPKDDLIIFTGGDIRTKSSDLYLAQKNENQKYIIKKHEKLEENIFWHPTGISIEENQLIIPISNAGSKNKKTIIKILKLNFEDLSLELINDPLKSIIKDSTSSIGTILENNLMKIFRLSDSKKIWPLIYHFDPTINSEKIFSKYSSTFGNNINGQGATLVHQCDGKVFLTTFDNTSKIAPLIPGKDILSLYELLKNNQNETYEIKRVLDKELKCEKWCNFDAGTSAFIEEGKLGVISIHHFRSSKDNHFKIRIFRD